MIKFKMLFLCAVCICTFLLMGCTEEEMQQRKNVMENQPVDNTFVPPDNMENYDEVLAENLIVDAEVSKPDITSAAVLQVESFSFDSQPLCDAFFDSKNIKKEVSGVGELYSFGDKTLSISEDRKNFSFYSPLKEFIQGVINTEHFGNLYKFNQEELDFMPKQKAIDGAVNILKSLNITPHMPPKVYAIDFKTIQKVQEERMLEKGVQEFINLGIYKMKDEWTKDDEFYYLFFSVDFYGIPCDTIGYTHQSSTLHVSGSEIEIIISKKGIELCMIDGMLYREVKPKSEKSELISIDQAMQTVKSKFDDVILMDKVTVTEICLEYLPVLVDVNVDTKTGIVNYENVELVPIWLFKIESSNSRESGIARNTYVRVNAITGKEIL